LLVVDHWSYFLKVLFAYNGPLRKDAKGNYYGNELGNDLVRRYKNLGTSVTFMVRVKLISSDETLKMTRIDESGFSVIEIPEFNSVKALFFNRRRINQIIEIAIQQHDLLVARLPSFVARKAIDSANRLKKAVMVEAVGCPWDALFHHSFSGKLLAPWAYFQMRRYIAKAPFVIYVTRNFLQHRYPNNHRNMGISDVVIRQTNDDVLERRNRRIKDRIESDAPLAIGTIAGLDASFKGQESVIKALAGLKKDGFLCKYFLVGRGNGFKLKQLVRAYKLEDDVVFLGELPHHTIFPFLDGIDAYIQPSKQEGLPRALAEAMSRGCTCFGTKVGGIPELLEPTMLFNADAISEIQQKLKGLNTQTLIEQAQRNISVSAAYHPDILNKRRNDFYKEFLNANGLLM
jgi:glycosyltransferase involved in cell wall biosynthesis